MIYTVIYVYYEWIRMYIPRSSLRVLFLASFPKGAFQKSEAILNFWRQIFVFCSRVPSFSNIAFVIFWSGKFWGHDGCSTKRPGCSLLKWIVFFSWFSMIQWFTSTKTHETSVQQCNEICKGVIPTLWMLEVDEYIWWKKTTHQDSSCQKAARWRPEFSNPSWQMMLRGM